MLFFRFIYIYIYEFYICGIFHGVFIERVCERLESPHCSCAVMGAEPAVGGGGMLRPFRADALLSWTRKHKIVEGRRVTWWLRKFVEVDEAGGHSRSLLLLLLFLLHVSCPTLSNCHPTCLNVSPAPTPAPTLLTKCCKLTSLTTRNIYEQD